MSKPVILAVDDDPDVLAAISRDLRARYGKDYRVLRAESAAAALDVVRELSDRDDPIAMLLSDQRMPGKDGVAFLAEARRIAPAAKRALLTAYAETDDAIAAINRSQVDYYLLKPWDPPEDKLYPVIDELLDEWRAGHRPGPPGIKVLSDRWSAESHALRDFLSRHQVPYRFYDVETREGRDLAKRADGDGVRLPVVFLESGERLSAPTTTEIAERIGLRTEAGQPSYDLAIVGAGPAGLAAAVYGGSEGLRTVLLEREAPGGQAGTSSRIENYLGFPNGLSGGELTRRAVTQARKFDVEIIAPQEVTGLEVEYPYKKLTLASGRTVSCHALMLSMGVSWIRLPVPGADALAGRGFYYGAALTESRLCAGETVYLVGAGNSAGQAALEFAEHAGRVVLLCRGSTLGAKMSQYLVDRIEKSESIEVQLDTEVVECHGKDRLEALTLKRRSSGATEKVTASYLFAFLGAEPHTEWLRGAIALDARGFVLTGPDLDRERDLGAWPLERAPMLLEASVPGVFAAGDIRHDSVKRVASAVGEGSVAVHFIHRFLAEL